MGQTTAGGEQDFKHIGVPRSITFEHQYCLLFSHALAVIMPGSEDCVETEIGYFSRDKKYDEEKPYTTSFPVDDIPGAKVDNHQWEFFPSQVRNCRSELVPDLDVHGFQYVECDTSLSRSDFAIEQCVVTRYYSELAEMLKRLFPRYKKLAFFDHAVSDPARHLKQNDFGVFLTKVETCRSGAEMSATLMPKGKRHPQPNPFVSLMSTTLNMVPNSDYRMRWVQKLRNSSKPSATC